MQLATRMPGTSHRGPLPPLTTSQAELAARLGRHVAAIGSSEHNTRHPARLAAAARYIEETLSGMGYAVRSQVIPDTEGAPRNLEVRISANPSAGSGPASRPGVVVVGAHYDSAIGSPGANDNASGVAAVLELARMLKKEAGSNRHDIVLVLYANEEAPFFKTEQMGSHVHARALKDQGIPVAAMLSLETLGYYSDAPGSQHYPPPLDRYYPDTGNFVGFVGDPGAQALVERAISLFREHARFPSEGIAAPASFPGIDWSDHWAYRQFGYPAIMITDTAPYRYPFYHTAQDLPDKVDTARLARVVEGLSSVVQRLAAAP